MDVFLKHRVCIQRKLIGQCYFIPVWLCFLLAVCNFFLLTHSIKIASNVIHELSIFGNCVQCLCRRTARTTTGLQQLVHRTDKLSYTQAAGLTSGTTSVSTTVSIEGFGSLDLHSPQCSFVIFKKMWENVMFLAENTIQQNTASKYSLITAVKSTRVAVKRSPTGCGKNYPRKVFWHYFSNDLTF